MVCAINDGTEFMPTESTGNKSTSVRTPRDSRRCRILFPGEGDLDFVFSVQFVIV